MKVVKNKVAPPFKQVEFDIMFGEGVSKVGELIDLGVKAGIVEKSGAWFSYDSQRLGQGRENAKQFLRDNPEVADKIEASIRQNAGLLADRILDQATPTDEDLDEGVADSEFVRLLQGQTRGRRERSRRPFRYSDQASSRRQRSGDPESRARMAPPSANDPGSPVGVRDDAGLAGHTPPRQRAARAAKTGQHSYLFGPLKSPTCKS